MRLPGGGGGLSLPKENLLGSLNSVGFNGGGGRDDGIEIEETQQLWQQLNLVLNTVNICSSGLEVT